MRFLWNESVYGYKMTGLLGKGGMWFIGYSRNPETDKVKDQESSAVKA